MNEYIIGKITNVFIFTLAFLCVISSMRSDILTPEQFESARVCGFIVAIFAITNFATILFIGLWKFNKYLEQKINV